MELESQVEAFETLALEKLPDGLWSRLYEPILGKLGPALVGRLVFRLFVEIRELRAEIAALKK
jgi:hypothetical protein